MGIKAVKLSTGCIVKQKLSLSHLKYVQRSSVQHKHRNCFIMLYLALVLAKFQSNLYRDYLPDINKFTYINSRTNVLKFQFQNKTTRTQYFQVNKISNQYILNFRFILIVNWSALNMSKQIQKAAQFIKFSQSILIGAGAGMGKDSGLPDFRGNQGFWNNYPPYRNKFNFFECANPQFLHENPHLFWGFYGSRLKMYRQTKPHKGFKILKDIADKKHSNFVVTSNVDGHFNELFKQNVFQVHGSIHHLQCTNCQVIIHNDFQPQINFKQMSCINLPKCSKCDQIMRPNILMFSDYDWDDSRSEQQSLRYQQYIRNLGDRSVVMLQFGCGTTVPTIRKMMEIFFYRNKKSKFIRVNPFDDSNYDWMDKDRFMVLKMGALQALEKIQAKMTQL